MLVAVSHQGQVPVIAQDTYLHLNQDYLSTFKATVIITACTSML